jgi:hypothetical protein
MRVRKGKVRWRPSSLWYIRSIVTSEDRALLEAALVGYQIERRRIEQAIEDLRGRLGAKKPATKSSTATAHPRRKLSAAARKRIAAAQKKRWAEYRKK